MHIMRFRERERERSYDVCSSYDTLDACDHR